MWHRWHLAFVISIACSSTDRSGRDPAADHRPTGTPVNVTDLFGQWVDHQDNGRTQVHEHWSRSADGTPSGLGFVLSGQDTIHIEHIALLTVRDTLHYAVSIGRHGGQATLFKLVHDRDSLVFTNPTHDMPQRIVYVPQGPEAWHVIVSGTQQGHRAEDHYHFERVRQEDQTP